MNNLLKIFKINFLSIIAIPFLFISTTSKMLAKALEKMTVMITTTFYAVLFLLFFHYVSIPHSTVEVFKFILLLLLYLVLIFATSFLFLHLLSGLLAIVWNATMNIFDSIYRTTYQYYLSMLEICQRDYSYICLNKSTKFKMICCLFYSLLRFLNCTIMLFLHYSLFLSIATCLFAAIYTIFRINQKVHKIFGYNLIIFLKKFDTFSLVYGFISILCIFAIIVVALISLGIEWNEWSNEMQMTKPEYHKRIEEIKSELKEANSSLYAVEPYRSYMADLAFHADGLSGLENSIDAILSAQNDPLLHSLWSRYVINIQEISAVCSPEEGEPTKEDFNIMIPRIQKLERQKREIDHIISRIKLPATEEAPTPEPATES